VIVSQSENVSARWGVNLTYGYHRGDQPSLTLLVTARGCSRMAMAGQQAIRAGD
jgi:hypothetical protein